MIDHLKECEWCEHYDHPVRKLEVDHQPSDYPTDAPSIDALLAHLGKVTGLSAVISSDSDEEEDGDTNSACP
jgi:hypothetical protein